MSSYTIIHDITLELRRRIHAALLSAPDADLGMTTPETDITLSLPTNDMAGSPRLSLYMYYVEPDGTLRNQRLLEVSATDQRFPPLALQLHYLITPLADEEDQNHLILGRVLQHFHDAPFVDSLNGGPLDDSFGGNSNQVRIHLESLTMEQLSQIWGALNTDYRISVGYTVRVVTVDSDRGPVQAKRVREAYTVVGVKE